MQTPFLPSAALRAKAELLLRASTAYHDMGVDPHELIHELRLHQIELDMQNEALREAYVALEYMADRYRSLYDHAPVAYLTLDMECKVLDANRAAIKLFATRREDLIGTRISVFVAPEHAERFVLHRNQVLASFTTSRCLLDILCGDAPEVRHQVRLESIRTFDAPDSWRVAIIETELGQRG